MIATSPCAHTPVGACLPNPAAPARCLYCEQVVQHARTRLAVLLDQANPTLLTVVRQGLALDEHLRTAVDHITTRPARRPWHRKAS